MVNKVALFKLLFNKNLKKLTKFPEKYNFLRFSVVGAFSTVFCCIKNTFYKDNGCTEHIRNN